MKSPFTLRPIILATVAAAFVIVAAGCETSSTGSGSASQTASTPSSGVGPGGHAPATNESHVGPTNAGPAGSR